MKLHLILITFSTFAWAFNGWYVYRLAPESRLNRACAAWGLFVAAWSLLLLVRVAGSEGGEAAAWYDGEQFSYLPKSVLFLHFILYLTGYRKRVPRLALAFVYLLAGATVALGLCYLASLPLGLRVHEALSRGGRGASPLRSVYAALSIVLYSCSACLIVLWNRSTGLRRERRLSLYFLALLALVVGANALLSLLKAGLGAFEVDFLLVLQGAQAFPSVFAIDHYQSLRSVEDIVTEQLRSQLSFPVTIVDQEGLIVSANAAAAELSGRSPESLAGQPFEALLGGTPCPQLRDSGVAFFEVEYRSQGGEAMPMSLSVTPVRDRWGDCAGYVLAGRPIKRLLERQKELGLSEREREVSVLLIQGLTNQEIADKLFISPGTIKNHVYNIYEKTGVKNRVELSRLFS